MSSGIAFVYEPVIPDSVLGGIPTDLIEVQREENTKAAKDAIGRFEAAVKKAGVAAETRILDASLAGAATCSDRSRGASTSRSSVRPNASKARPRTLMIEGALFESGRPRRRALHPEARPHARARDGVLGRRAHRRARHRRRHAAPRARQGGRPRDRRRASGKEHDEITGANMSEHLARHGVRSTIKRIARATSRSRRDPVLRRRQRRRLHGDGRLRAFAPARVHPRRRHARHLASMTVPGADVALTRGQPVDFAILFYCSELRFSGGVIRRRLPCVVPSNSPLLRAADMEAAIVGPPGVSAMDYATPHEARSRNGRRCSRSASRRNISWSMPRPSSSPADVPPAFFDAAYRDRRAGLDRIPAAADRGDLVAARERGGRSGRAARAAPNRCRGGGRARPRHSRRRHASDRALAPRPADPQAALRRRDARPADDRPARPAVRPARACRAARSRRARRRDVPDAALSAAVPGARDLLAVLAVAATGLKGYRLAAYDELPRTGVPELFRTHEEFDAYVAALVRAGVIRIELHLVGDATLAQAIRPWNCAHPIPAR